MVMQEQARRLSQPLPWGRAQKRVVVVLVACALLGAGALLAFGLSSGAPARADCIDLTFPSTLGAAEVRGCGEQARRICLSGAYRGISAEMQAACEKAGFAYRRPPG
jgi:hypothetical protein